MPKMSEMGSQPVKQIATNKAETSSPSLEKSVSPDPAHDILRYGYQPLSPFFTPNAVAVIGATERPG
ncbi:MAG: hypothetical protein AAF808_04255, partial [Cyanobacteria bacterium P01_D01_bin.2]